MLGAREQLLEPGALLPDEAGDQEDAQRSVLEGLHSVLQEGLSDALFYARRNPGRRASPDYGRRRVHAVHHRSEGHVELQNEPIHRLRLGDIRTGPMQLLFVALVVHLWMVFLVRNAFARVPCLNIFNEILLRCTLSCVCHHDFDNV